MIMIYLRSVTLINFFGMSLLKLYKLRLFRIVDLSKNMLQEEFDSCKDMGVVSNFNSNSVRSDRLAKSLIEKKN